MFNNLIWVRGAGELGSAVTHLLHRVGFSVFTSDISPPFAIRRPVTFSDAIIDEVTEVDGVEAKLQAMFELPQTPWNHVPVFKDNPVSLRNLSPTILVDARMLKAYDNDYRTWADLVIGLGPGFHTAKNCHTVIETMRGHDLARVIHVGGSMKDTGVPGIIGGETSKRIVRAPHAGQVRWLVDFGEIVSEGQALGSMEDGTTISAPLTGIVRGLISPLTPVSKQMKIGDVDPRGAAVKYMQISEKARAIAAGVFEAIVLHLNKVTI